MLLRDHPLMFRRGVRNWPPVWTWINGQEDKRPRGEIGTLKAATLTKLHLRTAATYTSTMNEQNTLVAFCSMITPFAVK